MSEPTKSQILKAAGKCGISTGVFDGSRYPGAGQLHAFANEFRGPLLSRIAELEAQLEAARKDSRYAEYGRVAMRFVDRAGDVHPGIDDAETICAEFAEAMGKAIDAALAQPPEGIK